MTPPLFHLLRTSDGNRWLLGASLPAAQRERLASFLSAQRAISGCADAETHPPDLGPIRTAVAGHAPAVREYRGPAFFFPDALASPNRAELLTDPRETPRDGQFAWLHSPGATSQPIAVVRAETGEVASVCYSARSTSAAAEAGVETLEAYRGRGYGSIAVVAWAHSVRQSGRVPLYSTEWGNSASRALARRLGLVCYAEDLHIG